MIYDNNYECLITDSTEFGDTPVKNAVLMTIAGMCPIVTTWLYVATCINMRTCVQ